MDRLSEIRTIISDTIQYDPKFAKYRLQVLSVVPLEHSYAWRITISVSTDLSPMLTTSYTQGYKDETLKCLLNGFEEISFMAAVDDMVAE